MDFIIQLVINAVVLLIAAYILPKVEIRSFFTALWVAFLVGLIGGLIGWLLRGALHVGTLGIPALLGLSFIIRLIATAVVIKIVDAVVPGFKVHGFMQALLLAVIIALVGAAMDHIFNNDASTMIMQHMRLFA